MAINTAPGYPQTSGVLIPEVWSGKLLVKFYDATVAAATANTDYEGEIQAQGDKVWIRTVPDISIFDYTKGSSLPIQRPESSKISLNIDRAKGWNFAVDNIDKFQSDIPFMDKWAMDASTQLKIRWDTDYLGSIYLSAAAANKGALAGKQSASINLGAAGAPLQLTTANVVNFLIDCGNVLDEQSVPEEDRFVILPAWAVALLKKSNLQQAYLTGDTVSVIRNGRVGDIDRFTVYSSNLLSTFIDSSGGNPKCWNAIAGQKSAVTFASQFTENDTIKAESTFGWLARGLQVCGWQVINPVALVAAVIRQ